MQKSYRIFFLVVLCLTGLIACNDDFGNYSQNPDDLLSFSTDTISFDTVLTTVNSPKQIFLVYNRNSKPLLISSVSLAEGTNSPFKINVDGCAGSTFENIEIRANDSLFVLVDINPTENGQAVPTLINDYIVFVTNNVSRKVVLEAYGQDVFKWKGVVLTADSTLSNEKPYLIYDSLVVGESANVDIGEGIVFYMHNNAQLVVNGTIKIKGTIEKPVIFRGYRNDYLQTEPPIPFDCVPGQWGGIRFGTNSFGNEIENVQIRNGKFGMDFETSNPEQLKISLKNLILTNVTGVLFSAINCNISAENCEFSNSREVCLQITGGSYRFIHCTVANCYPYNIEGGWLKSENETLSLSNIYYPDSVETAESVYFPLNADFSNTIFATKSGKNKSGISFYGNDETAFDYVFRNCIFMDDGSNDEQFINCLFNISSDSLFSDNSEKMDRKDGIENYFFDFTLKENSPAIGVADPEISGLVPFDMKGKDRFADGYPDLGAYEYELRIKN
jgi:hypothetical protein